MGLKSWDEMRKIDVTEYCEKRDGFLYLNWAMCIMLLHQNGAKRVKWIPIPDSTGSSLRMASSTFTDSKGNTNRCYETRILVTIDENEYEMQSPVMNGVNPVKDNSMSQLRVWNSMCRSFVKCVAINTGLGFDLWINEEFDKRAANIPKTSDDLANEAKIKTLKNKCSSYGINLEIWSKQMGEGKDISNLTNEDVASMLLWIKQNYGDE